MRVTVEEIVNCLRKDLDATAGAAYARRIAATNGRYASEYERAAERLEREAPRQPEGTGMRAGVLHFGAYIFTVYDDGSLGCAHCWYEDPATAARDLRLPIVELERATAGVITAWRDRNAPRP